MTGMCQEIRSVFWVADDERQISAAPLCATIFPDCRPCFEQRSIRSQYDRVIGAFDADILKADVPYDAIIDMRFVKEVLASNPEK